MQPRSRWYTGGTSLRAEKILQDRLFANERIEIIWNHVVDEVIGNDDPPDVSAVRLRDVNSQSTQEVAIDGLFVAIGHVPETQLFKGQLDMDHEGYLITAADSTLASVPGVFARAMCRTRSIAKRLPRLEPAVWQRWKQPNFWPRAK